MSELMDRAYYFLTETYLGRLFVIILKAGFVYYLLFSTSLLEWVFSFRSMGLEDISARELLIIKSCLWITYLFNQEVKKGDLT